MNNNHAQNENQDLAINLTFVLATIAEIIEGADWELFDKGVIIPNVSSNEYVKETRFFTAHKGPRKELSMTVEDMTDVILIEAEITCDGKTAEVAVRFSNDIFEFIFEDDNDDNIDFGAVSELLGIVQRFAAELNRE